MKKTFIALFSGVLVLSAAAAFAQTQVRVRGNIAAVNGSVVSVKSREGKSLDVRLAEQTVIVVARPIPLAEIKPGDFLGVTSTRHADGKLTAFEVRRFPAPLNPGHRPFDGRSDQTMTNATVSAIVQSASGRELTLGYGGGSQKIIVPENASVSMLVPGDRSHLVPGAAVNLTAGSGADGTLTATRVQVSRPSR
jgi:hypothetical protein